MRGRGISRPEIQFSNRKYRANIGRTAGLIVSGTTNCHGRSGRNFYQKFMESRRGGVQ